MVSIPLCVYNRNNNIYYRLTQLWFIKIQTIKMRSKWLHVSALIGPSSGHIECVYKTGLNECCSSWDPISYSTHIYYCILYIYIILYILHIIISVIYVIIIIIIFSGAAAQRGLWPPRSRGFVITHNDAPQSVGLLWTSDQFVAETSTWQHATHTKNIHAPRGGI
jgi:hypothetical protein